MMKTAMEQLKETLLQQKENNRGNMSIGVDFRQGINKGIGIALMELDELLSVEREQLKSAYNDGVVGGKFGLAYTDSDNYFTENYKG